MTERKHEALHRHGHKAFMAFALMLMAGILILWGWNTLAVELFGATAARFKHALAFEAVAGGIWLAGYAVGYAMRGPLDREA
ncbi:MAG: hypothetical protein ACE5FM_02425 [Methyloligellaceae bacterium]